MTGNINWMRCSFNEKRNMFKQIKTQLLETQILLINHDILQGGQQAV